eukprot:gene31954-33738_t
MAFKLRSAAPITRTTRVARASRLVCQARGPLPGKPLNGSCVLNLSSGVHNCKKSVAMTNDPSTDLNSYMYALSQDFGILKMPLGASLRRLGGGGYEILMVTVDTQVPKIAILGVWFQPKALASVSKIEILDVWFQPKALAGVPKIEILDVWFQPKALAGVRIATPPEKRMELASNTCILNGSNHVTDLKLNDVFNLDVKVAFSWQDGSSGAPTIFSEASIDVDVDIPFPFSALPKPALEIPGNAAFNATLDIMLNGFVSSLVDDYHKWANDPALRAQREQAIAAAPPS